MQSRESAIREIFEKHGKEAIYVTPTGFISRAVYNIYPENKNIFYMQGSMGLTPSIALGIAKFTNRNVVALNGDAGHLMHLGQMHIIRDLDLKNLFVYILDNGVHESVGSQPCASLEEDYPGVNKIYKINCDGKTDRVKLSFSNNAKNIMEILESD